MLNFLNVVASGLMMWKALCLVTNSESPIVVVLSFVAPHSQLAASLELTPSGSMEPAFYRGDILFLTNPANTPYEIGDITVYKVYVCLAQLIRSRLKANDSPGDPSGTPIVHRVIESHIS